MEFGSGSSQWKVTDYLLIEIDAIKSLPASGNFGFFYMVIGKDKVFWFLLELEENEQ